ncbi:hypothetical protein HMPREF9195_00973 [Treponema medium ATCC 700293]|uniref:Uncharacterized protein n=2 Tax=Treponema medium TaxID=58231 RepID=A0AA87NSK4_TREMD|nr:hypothetical protein [Treponema medium]EPF29191.1 hypothetical protein HMPREF9195_00973 [Treponema medium ATCC 700293]
MSIPVLKYYDAKIESKKRVTLRNASYEYFHVEEYDDGRILLEPRELTKPFQVSVNTLKMMDTSMENFNKSLVSEPIDISTYGDIE